jgi:quinol monooxygenase YgiN
MSVIVTLRVQADPRKLEQFAAENPGKLSEIAERGKEHGVLAHRFYGSEEDGSIIVIDEWPDADSFRSFFESQNADIGSVMQAVGVTGEPEIIFWRKLETNDEIGWGA